MDRFKGKKVLIIGIGKTGFALIKFFNNLGCEIRVTDIMPIFDLNKAIKRLKRIVPQPETTFGEHRKEDFLDADVICYSAAVGPDLPFLELARSYGKQVYSEFELANLFCNRPVILIAGTYGRTTVSYMLAFILKQEGKNVFVGGTKENPFIEFAMLPDRDSVDYVILEISAKQSYKLNSLKSCMIVYTSIGENYSTNLFPSVSKYIEVKLSILKTLTEDGILIVNFDTLSNNSILREDKHSTYWYSRRSFVKMGVIRDFQGTHFHNRRIHSNINYHSEFIVSKMRIVGVHNRENLLAAITAAKALDISDKSIQTCIEKFPGIPHRVEFLIEKNGVAFYNDSKSETMEEMIDAFASFTRPIILIAGGKDSESVSFDKYADTIIEKVRVLILIGECKERFNRSMSNHSQTFIVGSFEESVLFAYQKSRTGDVILLSPGNTASDFFRDYEERGNYFKKLVYQL
jgi:UDP-N-acetylmuramoylalanine--D-glutamate ligase